MPNRYEIVARTSLLGVTALNRFWFQPTVGGDTIGGALSAFQAAFPNVWRPLISSSAVVNQLTCSQYDNGWIKRGEMTVGAAWAGQRINDCMPPYVSWGFKLLSDVIGNGLRNGAKRIAGVAESDVVNGVYNSGMATAITNFQDVLRQTLTAAGVTYAPILLHRVVPTNPSTWVWTNIAGAIFNSVTTQNSRKFGRGI